MLKPCNFRQKKSSDIFYVKYTSVGPMRVHNPGNHDFYKVSKQNLCFPLQLDFKEAFNITISHFRSKLLEKYWFFSICGTKSKRHRRLIFILWTLLGCTLSVLSMKTIRDFTWNNPIDIAFIPSFLHCLCCLLCAVFSLTGIVIGKEKTTKYEFYCNFWRNK